MDAPSLLDQWTRALLVFSQSDMTRWMLVQSPCGLHSCFGSRSKVLIWSQDISEKS